jgi:alpha-L-arabinofuranosidase
VTICRYLRPNREQVISVFLSCCLSALALGQSGMTASLTIDASKIENRISSTLYGQFAEFMFEDIKGSLYAELVRDRGFDESPNALGLPRYWERIPDDRNDDGDMKFAWDAGVYSPARGDENPIPSQHSLQVHITRDDGQRRGIRQSWIPIRKGLAYRGYIWLKTADYDGSITVALEHDETDGERYASALLRDVKGEWRQYPLTLVPEKSDALAKIVILFNGHGRLWLDQVVLDSGRRRRRGTARCRAESCGAASRIHSLARRKRCARLSLAVGGPARSASGAGQHRLGK